MATPTSYQAYLPARVHMDKGEAIEILIDFEGAPWMYAREEDNLWALDDDTDEYEWITDNDAEAEAMAAFEDALRPFNAEAEHKLEHCPVCGRHDLTGGPVTTGDGMAAQEMSCDWCGATWLDLYRGFEQTDIETGEE